MKNLLLYLLLIIFCISCDKAEEIIIEGPDDTVDVDDSNKWKDPSGNWTWKDKHILWLGTSIPAGGRNTSSYPAYVAKKLGAIIHNEAEGGSMIRSSDYKGNWVGLGWNNLSGALTHTIKEKELLINYFDSGLNKYGEIEEGGEYGWKDLCIVTPSFLSDKEKKFILYCSYQKKIIQKYLDPSSSEFIVKPDVIVIDHGYNDLVAKYYDQSESTACAIPKDINDRRTYIGATNFIVNLIREHYPDQKIIFIGHYESDRKEIIYKAQLSLFEYWKNDYPSFKLWQVLGWSQEIDPETGKTITKLNMPDDLHPGSDTRIDEETGFKVAIKQIGECCYNFLKDIY